MNRTLWLLSCTCVLLGCVPITASDAPALPERLTVEWIYSAEGRDAVAEPTYGFAGNTIIRYDRSLPVVERTVELLDVRTGEVVVRVDREKALASLAEFVPRKKKSAEDEAEEAEELGSPTVVSHDGTRGLYAKKGDLFLLEFATSTYTRLTETEEKEKSAGFSPDDSQIAFVRDNDLYVRDIEAGKESRLTRDGSETTLNGTLSWVYWEELFGRRDRGYLFSPDSKKIAFLQFDDSPVDVMTFVDPGPDATRVIRQRYPKAGTTNPRVRAGIVDINSKKTNWIDLGTNPYEYLVRLVWLPDGERLVVQTLDRAQQNLDLFLVDGANGEASHLFRETDEAWIDVHDDLVFLADGRRFLWVSSRTGHDHIFLYEVDENGARVVRQLTSGDWSVTDSARRADGLRGAIAGVDEEKGVVYFMSRKESHLESHLYSVRLNGKGMKKLTRDEGSHSTSWSANGRFCLDSHSSLTRPRAVDLLDAGSRIRTVVEPSTVVAEQFGFSRPELIRVKADDGFELPAIIMKPKGFDPEKRYPVIVNVYGGPASPRVGNRWYGSLYDQLLCADGFLLFTIDPRTSTAMGKPVTKQLLGDFYGAKEAADIVAGVRWLKTQPYVDPDRFGVTGWSGGGSTTLSVMTRSKEFRAGISGAGVYDYRLYDTIYTERFMKHPDENAEGYDNTGQLSKVENLHGRLLLMHGSYDDNVHPQNTWRLVDNLIDAGIVFDLVIYPMRKHGFRDDEARLHRAKTQLEFWRRELGGGKAN